MFFRHTAPAFLWALLILLLCGMPGEAVPQLDFWDLFQFDKLIHAVIFGIQVLLLTVAFKKQYTFSRLKYYAAGSALVLGILYGIATEYLQLYVFSNRSFDIYDMTANTIGSFFGTIGFYILYGKK